MARLLAGLRRAVADSLDRRRQRPFLVAAMNACALVALADGEVSFSERSRMDAMLESLAEFRAFDPHVAVDIFNDALQRLIDDPAAGRHAALDTVRPMRAEPDLARLLIRVCLALSHADGDYSPGEQVAVADLCAALDLDPAEAAESQVADIQASASESGGAG